MTLGSLFSGIGGFDLGFERAGMRVAWQCERDAAAASVLRRHWPTVPLYDDVTTLKGADAPTVDLLCGGFPCQDLSVAGQRRGLAGSRSGLWFHFLRLAEETRAPWIVVENVPGLLSSHGGRDFAVLLHGLVECGYRVAWRVLDAQFFGLAQRRKRVFVVGHRGDGRAAEILFESESVCRDSAPVRAAREGVAGSLGGGAGSRGWADDTDRMTFLPTAFNWQNGSGSSEDAHDGLALVEDGTGPLSCSQTVAITHALRADGFDASEDGTGRGTPLVAFQPRIARNGRGDMGDHVNALQAQSGQTGKGDAAPCIAATTGVRRLTPRECERLQGFPDDWTLTRADSTAQADGPRYKQLGNAVAVPVAEWIGRRIVEVAA